MRRLCAGLTAVALCGITLEAGSGVAWAAPCPLYQYQERDSSTILTLPGEDYEPIPGTDVTGGGPSGLGAGTAPQSVPEVREPIVTAIPPQYWEGVPGTRVVRIDNVRYYVCFDDDQRIGG